MKFRLPATKAHAQEVLAAYRVGYADGFKAGYKNAESHIFALPDIEPSEDDLRSAGDRQRARDAADERRQMRAASEGGEYGLAEYKPTELSNDEEGHPC